VAFPKGFAEFLTYPCSRSKIKAARKETALPRSDNKKASKVSFTTAASGSTSRKEMSSRLPKKYSFRFLDLPLDIRRNIYDVCLILPARVCIRPETSSGRNDIYVIPRNQAAKYNDLINLTSDHGAACFSHELIRRCFAPGVLGTCRSIYAEAAPVLYSQTEFRFLCEVDVSAFVFFHHRLSDISRISLRYLDIKISQIERFWNSTEKECELSFDHIDEWLVDAIKSFTGLKRLRLLTVPLIMDDEVALTKQFYTIKGSQRNPLEVERAKHWGDHGRHPSLLAMDPHMFADICVETSTKRPIHRRSFGSSLP